MLFNAIQTAVSGLEPKIRHWAEIDPRPAGLRSNKGIWLTGFADPDLLQVGLLDVVEVLDAGDVEAISDARVELLQLDLNQEMVQPLSFLVHQHHPAHLPGGLKGRAAVVRPFVHLEHWISSIKSR